MRSSSIMESDDDINPLLQNNSNLRQQILDEIHTQRLSCDPEFDQTLFGYSKAPCKAFFTYLISITFIGIPFLFFHWYPTLKLYCTHKKCQLSRAEKVLIVETYQKKCQSFYIHCILEKHLKESSGINNAGYQEDVDINSSYTNENTLAPIHFDDGTIVYMSHYKFFVHKKSTMIWDTTRSIFVQLSGIESGSSCADLQKMGSVPPSPDRRNIMLNVYGLNEIKVPMHSIMALIALEVFNPFYMFQVFTIAVWLAEPYYYYCGAVVLMSLFGITTSVMQTRRNQRSLSATVAAEDTVLVWGPGGARETDCRHVAPGDLVVLPSHGCVLHFDGVLLAGSCIVNESMLTGESVPVTKTALLRVDKPYSFKEHSSNTLFSGTRVIQTRYYNNEPVKALVLRTGYGTAKGQLVRSILYPVPADFKFDRDSYKFIFILTVIALLGLIYTVVLKAYSGFDVGDIILKALDIITIVIPPALPAAMTVGKLYAVARLEKCKIFCLNTRAVNVSGSVDCVCFDKTGTLTEDGLDMWGVVPVQQETFPPTLGRPSSEPRMLNDLDDLKLGMTVCHSLTLLDGQLAGDPLDLKMFESTGWVLEEPDVPDSAKYELLVPTVVRPARCSNVNVDDVHVPLEVGIVQQHQFVSSLQRSSVVVRLLGENIFRVYCKGSPEMLRTLCVPSTVPGNLEEVLSRYAEKGYRVIAMSTKIIELQTIKQLQKTTREQVECDLQFLGLIIMENRLKPATIGVIKELKEADIHVAMITGDNIHTAVSVAKECGILRAGERVVHLYTDTACTDKTPRVLVANSLYGMPIGKPTALSPSKSIDSGHFSEFNSSSSISVGKNGSFLGSGSSDGSLESGLTDVNYKIVMTGDTWRVLREHYGAQLGHVVARGAVFARFSSDQKQQLIVEYQALGYYVAMCGDGANDCGALRAAHTGISLSELESSVAAPFTSRCPDISCTLAVLREGRAALVTSFGVFKFMIAYSLTEFLSVAFLYYFDSNLTDFEFLFIDVALIVNFAFFFGRTEAYGGKLSRLPPQTSLLSLVPLLSIGMQMLFIAASQYLSYYVLTLFPWYQRHRYVGDEDYECWENYAVYSVSMFQYIALAIVFSHGAPYRKSVITNAPLMISIAIMTALCVYITVYPAKWLADFLQLVLPLDITFSYLVLAIAAIYFIVALFFERFVIQYMMEEKEIIPKFIKERKIRKTPHLRLKREFTSFDYLDSQSVVRSEFENGQNGHSHQRSSRST